MPPLVFNAREFIFRGDMEAASYPKTDSGAAGELNETADTLAPADAFDPLIEAFKQDVDRTLLRENLKLSVQQRTEKFVDFARFSYRMRQAGEAARRRDPKWGL